MNKNKHNNRYFNSISFDIEEWYHANYDDVLIDSFQNKATNLEDNVDRLVDVCEKYRVKSTCFVLGTVARDKPEIVRKLHNAGHEIASHGFSHKLVYSMTEKEFLKELNQSKDILEDITGESVKGFRAPSWSVREDILDWYYSALEQAGFVYSSSVYPAYTYLYGIPGFSQNAHYPEINGARVNVLEIPVPVFGAFKKYVGYSGGFYLRFFPAWFIKYLLNRANAKGQSTFIYLHPREIDINQPRLSLNKLESFIHYFGINGCEKKLDNILSSISKSCVPISDGITKIIVDEN